jgi:hypothetical protein
MAQRIVTELIDTTELSPAQTANAVADIMNRVAKGLPATEYIASFQIVPIDGSSTHVEDYALLITFLIDMAGP